MKKRSLAFLSKGIGYQTAVFFTGADRGRGMSKSG